MKNIIILTDSKFGIAQVSETQYLTINALLKAYYTGHLATEAVSPSESPSANTSLAFFEKELSVLIAYSQSIKADIYSVADALERVEQAIRIINTEYVERGGQLVNRFHELRHALKNDYDLLSVFSDNDLLAK